MIKEKSSTRDRHLLLINGHSSHVNFSFIEYADRNRIILTIFSLHFTYRLQSLNIGFFLLLSYEYSKQLDRFLIDSQSLVRFTKRDF